MSTKPIMPIATPTAFERFLQEHDSEAWLATITALLRSIHEVDKSATQIWFSFYPLDLFQALREAEDPQQLARELLLQGDYLLKDQIDTSHRFLYGHRFWPQVKQGIAEHAASFTETNDKALTDQIIDVASQLAASLRVDPSLTTGIAAAGFMTVQQVGLAAARARETDTLTRTRSCRPNRFSKSERRMTARVC